MPTRVITITSGKGGVGKTTTTANLGVALAKLGKRVVVVDTDIGLRNLDVLMGLQNRIIYDIVDLIEGRCRLRQALIRDKLMPELYLLPAAQSRDKSAVSPADMIRVCGQLRGECDFVLVDSPAGIESGFRNAVAAADEFILLVTPDPASVQDADRVLGILESGGHHNLSLIINRISLRPTISSRRCRSICWASCPRQRRSWSRTIGAYLSPTISALWWARHIRTSHAASWASVYPLFPYWKDVRAFWRGSASRTARRDKLSTQECHFNDAKTLVALL